ncbi:MAG: rod shape-determining protein MreD [Deltaproteobacteria bacterium]|nr:rod shape-determining protein MreD [Deltaproteobacteria bacterium]
MRAAAVIGLVAGFGVLLQTTLFHVLPLHLRLSPDVLLVIVVFLGLHRHTVGAVLTAFVLGYVQDAVSGGAVGLNAFGMVAVYVLVYLTCRRLWVDNVLSKVVLVFLASWVKAVAVLAVSAVFGAADGAWAATLGGVLANALAAAVLAPPVFALLAGARMVDARDDD